MIDPIVVEGDIIQFDDYFKLYKEHYPNGGSSVSFPACDRIEVLNNGIVCGCWGCHYLRMRR